MPELVVPPPEPRVVAHLPMIHVEDVWKSFGELSVLQGVSFDVPEGSTFVLLGRSGSGKSVLFRHLDGLLQPDRGRVVLDGHDLSHLGRGELEVLRRELGIQFQGNALLDSLTVFDNVALPLREIGHQKPAAVRERVRETLELLSLTDAAQEMPGNLSGGMMKRVAFARAIALKPKILLSDEPAAGLDPITSKAVEDAITAARRTLGCTAFVITFSLATAFHIADQVGFLHEGRIVEQGPPDAFRRSSHPAVREFLHSWLEREQASRAV